MSSDYSEMLLHCDEVAEIQAAQFGHRTLNMRAAKLIKAMSKNHQVDSINSTFNGHADTQAAYRFFNNKKVSAQVLIGAHQEQILLRSQKQKRILLAQDTSELDYTKNTTLEGSGAIALSKSNRKGFFLHAHYVMDANHVPLGVWDLDFGTFDAEEIGKKDQRRHLPIEEKTSYRWLEGYRKACDLQAKTPDTEVLSLADREGDIFEIYTEHQARLARGERPAGFIIRAKENRALLDNKTHQDIAAGYLLEQDPLHEPLGSIKVELRSQKKIARKHGKKTAYQREAREATLEVRAYPVTPRPPKRVGKKLPILKLWLVTAKERHHPEDQPPIDWTLITNKPIATLAEATEVIADYNGRWGIEVFFRTLKTGCKVEKLRLKKSSALQASIALYSIIAWRLNFLVEHSRRNGNQPCSRYFSKEEWESTLAIITKQPPPEEPVSLREFIEEVAILGGYLGRKSDPPPGPQALWQGLQKVFNYAEAWLAFQSLQSST